MTSGATPERAASPENFAMSIGPESWRMEPVPRKRRPTIWPVTCTCRTFSRQDAASAADEPEAADDRLLLRGEADAPVLAFLDGDDVQRERLASALHDHLDGLRAVLVERGGRLADEAHDLEVEDDGLAVHGDDLVPDLQARLRAGIVRDDAGDDRGNRGVQARVADVVLAARLGREVERERRAVAHDPDGQLLARGEAGLDLDLLPRLHGFARDRVDAVAFLDARLLGRAPVVDDLHDGRLGLVGRDLDADEEREGREEEREDEVHAGSGEEDQEALEARAGLRRAPPRPPATMSLSSGPSPTTFT